MRTFLRCWVLRCGLARSRLLLLLFLFLLTLSFKPTMGSYQVTWSQSGCARYPRINVMQWLTTQHVGDDENGYHYDFAYQDNQGSDKDRQTLVLTSIGTTNPNQFRMAIRQHNIAHHDGRYTLTARLDCLQLHRISTQHAAHPGAYARWYFENERIRPHFYNNTAAVKYSLERADRSVLVIGNLQVDPHHYILANGQYSCSLSRNGREFYRAQVDVMLLCEPFTFDGPTGSCFAGTWQGAFIKVLKMGLTWVQVQWTLNSDHCTRVTKLALYINEKHQPRQAITLDLNERGTFNFTGLRKNTLYLIRSGTNRDSLSIPLTVRTESYASVRCHDENITAISGEDASIVCSLTGTGPFSILPRNNNTRLTHYAGGGVVKLTWLALRGRTDTCFSVRNKYNVVRTCINKTIYCRPLPAPVNAFTTVTNAMTMYAKTFFHCNDGYHLIGSRRRKCMMTSSEWDGVQPVCTAYSPANVTMDTSTAVLHVAKGLEYTVTCHATGVPQPAIHVTMVSKGEGAANAGDPPLSTKVADIDGGAGKIITVLASARVEDTYKLLCLAVNRFNVAQASVEIAGM